MRCTGWLCAPSPSLQPKFDARRCRQRRGPSRTAATRNRTAADLRVGNTEGQGLKAATWNRIYRTGLEEATLRESGRALFETALEDLTKLSRPAAEEDTDAKNVVNFVRQCLHGMHELKVTRYRVAGSFGRRTSVRGDFDVDTLVFVSAYDGQQLPYGDGWQDIGTYMSAVLHEVAQRLSNQRGCRVRDCKARDRAVLQMDVSGCEVDLLILPDFATELRPGEDPARRQHEAIMRPLYEQLIRDPLEVKHEPWRARAVTESLVEYVKSRLVPDWVKSVVRLLKAWYKYGLRSQGLARDIKSVVLEVVVLAAHEAFRQQTPLVAAEVHDSGGVPSRSELLVAALQLLEDAARGRRTVMVDAGEWGYPRRLGMRCRRIWGRHPVRVINPIDPTDNLAKHRGRRGPTWSRLAREARKLRRGLEQLCFEEVFEYSTLGQAVVLMLESGTQPMCQGGALRPGAKGTGRWGRGRRGTRRVGLRLRLARLRIKSLRWRCRDVLG